MTVYSHLPPKQQTFLFWFAPLANLATNVVTPIIVHKQVKRQPISENDKRNLVIQEVCRQVISGGIGLITYFGSALLSGLLTKRVEHRSFNQLVGGTIGSFIGYAFVRPLLSTELILRWLRQRGLIQNAAVQKKSHLSSSAALPPSRATGGMQHYLQGIEEKRSQFRGLA